MIETLDAAPKAALPGILPAGSTRSTPPAAGRCSSSSPARCASAPRPGSPRRRWPNTAGSTRPRSRRSGTGSSRPTRPCSPGSTAKARGPRPRPCRRSGRSMLSHPLEEEDLAKIDAEPERLVAEWKWDGIRVQIAAHRPARCGSTRAPATTSPRPSPRSSSAGRRLPGRARRRAAGRPGRAGGGAASTTCSSASTARRRPPSMLEDYPAFVRLYDLLLEDGEDLRPLPFTRAPRPARGVPRARTAAAHGPLAADPVREPGRAGRAAAGRPRPRPARG